MITTLLCACGAEIVERDGSERAAPGEECDKCGEQLVDGGGVEAATLKCQRRYVPNCDASLVADQRRGHDAAPAGVASGPPSTNCFDGDEP